MSGFQKSVKLYPAVGVPGQEVNPGQAIYTAENYISDGTLCSTMSLCYSHELRTSYEVSSSVGSCFHIYPARCQTMHSRNASVA